MNEFVIDITEVLINFKHLLDADSRVVLSSGFGGGKTYFLDKFKKAYSSEYNFITLYPTCYVISGNESILEYIKRDICFQLAKDFYIKEDKIDIKGILNDLMDEADIDDLLNVLLLIPALQPVIAAILAIRRKKERERFKLVSIIKRNKYSSDKYIKSFEKSGSIYDNDIYTKFIKRSLESFRKVDHKKTVLIIEDLDRIDPGHMFNILNIFGSHIDRHFIDSTDTTQNKFGFDKLITVMSYDNCRNLFENTYGESVDFDGYINKFLSSKPYIYSIVSSARKMMAEKLYSILDLDAEMDMDIIYNIKRELEHFSLRDIEKIYLFDPDTVIKQKPFFEINGLQVSRNSNLLRIYAYEVMYDISLLGYDEYSSSRNEMSNAQLFIPLYVLCHGEVKDFKIGRNFFKVEPEYDENNSLMSIKVRKAMSIISPYYQLSDFENTLHLIKEKAQIIDCYYTYSNEESDEDMRKEDNSEINEEEYEI